MNLQLFYLRPLLPAAFSLLVLLCNWHCQMGAAEELRRIGAASGNGPRPMSLPSGGCENESGCMCRGATLATMVDASPLAPQPADFLLPSLDPLAVEPAYSSPPAATNDVQMAPLISERKLRAHSVSFLN